MSEKVFNILKRGLFILAALVAYNLVSWSISTIQTNKVNNNLTTYFSEETWQTFNSTEGQFKVSFPKYPTINPSTTAKVNDVTLISTEYSADSKDGDNYNVTYYYSDVLPKDYNVKNGTEGAINGMVASNKSNQLLSSNLVSVGKHQGADYVVYNKDEALYLKGRMVIVSEGNDPVKMYNLMVVSKSGNPTDNFTKFINSFELL